MSRDSFALKRRVGVALEHAAFYEEMTALEYLRFFVRLFSVEGGEARIHSLLDRLNLLHFGNVVIASYSTGMRRKLNFARALLHRPEMLILDEPGSGLDPFGMKQVREILDEERRAGVTILVSSHILSEIERTVDRVGILAQGRLIAEDSMASLRKRVRVTQRLVIEIAGDARRAAAALRDLPCTAGVEAHEQILHVEIIDEPESRSAVSRALVASDALIIEMRRQELTLEETFINITEAYIGQLAGNGPPQSGGAGTS